MERQRASDFPQRLLNLFDGYVHGRMSRRLAVRMASDLAAGVPFYGAQPNAADTAKINLNA